MSVSGTEPLRKFVRAGAGAGKTYNLTREVVALALNYRAQQGEWPKTVLTTFTRKATQELKERMLLYCLDEKPEALEFVQSTSYLNITTMHGLLSGFLSRYGHGMGLPNQIKVVDSQQANFWRKQILRQMVAEYKDSDSLQIFTFSQLLDHLHEYEKVYWTDSAKPLGRTEDFVEVYRQWMELKADQLSEWMGQIASMELGDKWIDYLDKLEALRVSLLQPQPWDAWQAEIQGRLALRKPTKSKVTQPLPEDFKKTFDKFLEKLKDLSKEPDLAEEHWPKTIRVLGDFQKFADDFMERLIDKKKLEGALEANDLEYFSLRILKTRPDLVEKFSRDVNAWFIDEFQDTSPLQMQLLEPMIGQSSCYIVGDPQQSIYLFRGSRSEVFFEKANKMEAEGAMIQPLQDNYRSQSHLLEFFNVLFPMIHSSFSTMNPKVDPIPKETAVQITKVNDEELTGEIYGLSQELARLIQGGVLAKDICILSRTHRQSDQLQKTLTSLGFPVISHSSSQFYERREVIDGLSLLKFLINPWDDKNLITLMRSPWLGMTDQKIVNIIGEAEENYWPHFRKLFREQREGEPGRALLEARDQLDSKGYAWVFRRLLIQLGLLDYSQKVDSTGRREANLWKLINIVEKSARESGSCLLELVQHGYSGSQLEELGGDGDASSPVEPNKIHLMTVHASKGLQFDYVFIPFMHKKQKETTWNAFSHDTDQSFWTLRLPLSDPNNKSGGALEKLIVEKMADKERQESLRVLYVAMTRAKKKLFLSWSSKVDSSSWADHLQNTRSHWMEFPHLKYSEVEISEPQSYSDRGQEAKVPSFYDGTLSRFSILEKPSFSKDSSEEKWPSIQRSQKIRREGVVLHRVFESLKFHSLEDTKKYCATWLPDRAEEMGKAIDFIFTQNKVPLSAIIEKGHVEWGYQKATHDGVEEKRIDLWGIVDKTLWVVDYKTGSDSYREKAFLQMRDYAETLKVYLDWSGPVRMAAVYPFSQSLFVEEGS